MGFEALTVRDSSGAVVVETLACTDLPCCTRALPADTYTFEAVLGEENLQQQATVEAAPTCDRAVLWLTFTFDVARR